MLIVLIGVFCALKLIEKDKEVDTREMSNDYQSDTQEGAISNDMSEAQRYENQNHNFYIDIVGSTITSTESPGVYYFNVTAGIQSMTIAIPKSGSMKIPGESVGSVTYNGVVYDHREISAEGNVMDAYVVVHNGVMYSITTKYPELLSEFGFIN